MRLDQTIAARNPAISRRRARELIAGGAVLVNQRPVRVASREVSDSDDVRVVDVAKVLRVEPLVETADWLAVNKPAGVPSQPARDRKVLSLEERLRLQFREIYLVHRLDTPTSGVIVFARTAAAAARLSRLFASGEIRKTYLARIDPPIRGELTIDSPIDGKDALTIVRPRSGNLIEVEIKTGRTHQIRIHLASAGHPVLGDRRYNGKPAPRLMLHAWRLEHPSLGLVEAPSEID